LPRFSISGEQETEIAAVGPLTKTRHLHLKLPGTFNLIFRSQLQQQTSSSIRAGSSSNNSSIDVEDIIRLAIAYGFVVLLSSN